MEIEFPRATQVLVAKISMNATSDMVGRTRPNQNQPRGFVSSKNNHNEIVPDMCSDFEDQHRQGNTHSEIQYEKSHQLLIGEN